MSRNARLGFWFFLAYALVYLGFVAVCTFHYEWMGAIVVAGLNLAIVYGVGLIVLAVIMAAVYAAFCTNEPDMKNVRDAERPPAPSPGTAGRGLG